MFTKHVGDTLFNPAPVQGLCLLAVHYPSAVDDPKVLLYPDYQHDNVGRLVMIPGQLGGARPVQL